MSLSMCRLGIIALLLALQGFIFSRSITAAGDTVIRPEELTRLAAKANTFGHLRIIIGLKLPPPGFRPEGTLNPQEVKQQRIAIAAARESLFAGLSGYEFEVSRIYTSIPYTAIQVDADALQELADSPFVASIQEDSASPAHSPDSSGKMKKNTSSAGGDAATEQ